MNERVKNKNKVLLFVLHHKVINAMVKNIPERMQPIEVANLVQRYKPDVLVITGHDRYDKKRNTI